MTKKNRHQPQEKTCTKVILSINDIISIPDETFYGYYDIDTRELKEVG
jgi:hypothetical protein